ncbi:gamma-aminobutyrate permease [Arthrobacter nitrophenolicus]|uniref:Gamma-aminobutyrate permease n=1 Tax=Arthrobacter nitrophenolicus TaxID=683150 RepID=L8TGY6_9MICC|nr:gamma-aminobutyrate permease [Arthrobacter nitrophenolicus]
MNFFGNYIPWMAAVPQWAWALTALIVVLALNLVSVKGLRRNGILVRPDQSRALVIFLIVGTYFVIFGTPVDGQQSASASSPTTAASSPTACSP